MKWERLKTQADIDDLMEKINSFKDSVITEMNYVSGAFIHPGLLMYPVNAKRRLRVIFQNQKMDMPAIEIVFDEVERMNLRPTGTNQFAQITDVVMKKSKHLLCWAQTDEFNEEKIDKDLSYNEFTWIVAKRAQWRVIEGHLGNDPVYCPIK